MFSISAMSPPVTPRGSIFSPQQAAAPWSMYTLSVESPEKRQKLNPVPSTFGGVRPTAGVAKSFISRSNSLASRRLKRAPAVSPLQLSRLESESGLQSTGLSPIVKGLTLGKPILSTPVPPSSAGPAMKFRLQKPAPAKAAATLKGAMLPQLSVASPVTGLVSPPSSTPNKRAFNRPAPLSFGGKSPLGGLDLLPPPSPSMPHTPGGFAPMNLAVPMMMGEVSPSILLSQLTPPTASWAPKFFVTPPSPATVAPIPQADAPCVPSVGLAPCTPPWPKTGASLRKTIFDHVGKSQLSPMDMRGYMAMSMNS
ncbi:hypothetical protein H4S07_003955 [Coemansia furcata]|uniref:Uncharacterized protein n=1 Tax=Coemansia furcata TaxID=417177 RepID=A0ACC1LD77_9FUNG|nr:hypothetical protein H4S07_003955 [Coemansia furcata]